MTIREYSNEFRVEVVARAHAGESQRALSRELDIPIATLNGWLSESNEAGERVNKRDDHYDHLELWSRATALAAARIATNVEALPENGLTPRDLQSLAIVGGIATDKMLDLRDGRKGTQITVDNRSLQLPPGLSLDELRALALTPVERIEGPSEGDKTS